VIDQDQPGITVTAGANKDFAAEIYTDIEDVIALAEMKAELPLAAIYEAVEFASESEHEEDE